mgnify:CR=1 FL=1|jgi:hypothetical protein
MVIGVNERTDASREAELNPLTTIIQRRRDGDKAPGSRRRNRPRTYSALSSATKVRGRGIATATSTAVTRPQEKREKKVSALLGGDD